VNPLTRLPPGNQTKGDDLMPKKRLPPSERIDNDIKELRYNPNSELELPQRAF